MHNKFEPAFWLSWQLLRESAARNDGSLPAETRVDVQRHRSISILLNEIDQARNFPAMT